MVVAPDVVTYLRSPIARARPLGCQLLDREESGVEAAVRSFRADVVVADNHFPPFVAAPRLVYMWHGLGWKARNRTDIQTLYRRVTEQTGTDPRQRNPRFFAQCYGEPDRRWRVEQWGLHQESCPVIGMTFTDLLLAPPYDREALAHGYRIDVTGRKTVLISLTWHFGGIFASRHVRGGLPARIPGGDLASRLPGAGLVSRLPGSGLLSRLVKQTNDWDADLGLLRRLLEVARDQEANVLLCLHERKRYAPVYLGAVQDLTSRYDHVEIRHKDLYPDNLADLLVSDVMVTNLSSFITYFYVFGRPSIHLHPMPNPSAQDLPSASGTAPGQRGARTKCTVMRAKLRWGRVTYQRVAEDEPLWMADPEDNGGLMATDEESAAKALRQALQEPTCCHRRSAAWLAEHVFGIDGCTGQRFEQALRAVCE
jgi:hypothetical protein